MDLPIIFCSAGAQDGVLEAQVGPTDDEDANPHEENKLHSLLGSFPQVSYLCSEKCTHAGKSGLPACIPLKGQVADMGPATLSPGPIVSFHYLVGNL